MMLHRVHLAWAGFELTLVVIGTDCIGSYKSNYHTITVTFTPNKTDNYHIKNCEILSGIKPQQSSISYTYT